MAPRGGAANRRRNIHVAAAVGQTRERTRRRSAQRERTRRRSAQVTFLASASSGHSLVGSLIDGHPNAVVSNELNAFARWALAEGLRFSGSNALTPSDTPLWRRRQLFDAIYANALSCALVGRRQKYLRRADIPQRGRRDHTKRCRLRRQGRIDRSRRRRG